MDAVNNDGNNNNKDDDDDDGDDNRWWTGQNSKNIIIVLFPSFLRVDEGSILEETIVYHLTAFTSSVMFYFYV